MILNDVGDPIFSDSDLIREIYKGNLEKINLAKMDSNNIEYISYCDFVEDNKLKDWPIPDSYCGEVRTKKEIDSYYQKFWYMPEEYRSLDIESYLISMCNSEKEKDRVNIELELFKKHNMIDILHFLKYLIDKMKEDKILWGVGRGSRVASYSLFLLGVHKIDSIKYNLDIKEFLR